jgi:hypothetical protein
MTDRCGTLDGCRDHISRAEPYCDRCATSRRATKRLCGARGLEVSLPPTREKAAQLAGEAAVTLEHPARVTVEQG